MKTLNATVRIDDKEFKNLQICGRVDLQKREEGPSWVRDIEITSIKAPSDDGGEWVDITRELDKEDLDAIMGYLGYVANKRADDGLVHDWYVDEY